MPRQNTACKWCPNAGKQEYCYSMINNPNQRVMENIRKNGISESTRKVKAKKKDGFSKNATQRTLWLSNIEETFRKNAIPFPRGGRLITTINPKSKQVSHTWVPQK